MVLKIFSESVCRLYYPYLVGMQLLEHISWQVNTFSKSDMPNVVLDMVNVNTNYTASTETTLTFLTSTSRY